ncbi:MAG: hypothetical protein K6G55_04590 [Selenomonadaceae bacterium]|nr:hypothetical protein [Selenomonadaceae bacterium]
MENRKNLLNRLKEMFGDCSLQSFLKKLRNFFNGGNQDNSGNQYNGVNQYNGGNQDNKDEENFKPLDINSTDAWHEYVKSLKNTSRLSDCLSEFNTLLKKSNMAPFAKSVRNAIDKIPNYVDKHFKEPCDINEETSYETAQQTGKFVKNVLWDLLRGCHSGMKYSQGEEKVFYEPFERQMEDYLSSIGVYRKDIVSGMDVRENAKWFETPFIRETTASARWGKIDEIEVMPHFIPYHDEYDNTDELILKGVCIVFGKDKKKG